MRCNNHDDLLHLSFILKNLIFSDFYLDPNRKSMMERFFAKKKAANYIDTLGFQISLCFYLQTVQALYFFKVFYLFKGAKKLYSRHYSCVIIILFNTGLQKSVFSTDSFGKLVFFIFLSFLCFLYVLCQIRRKLYINFLTLHHHCLHSSSVFLFSFI